MTEYNELEDRLEEVEDSLETETPLTVECIWSYEEPDGDPDLLIRRSLVMLRHRAKEMGYEILGPAETGTKDDAVRVRMKEGDGDRGGTDSG